jgi:hypothetical protein
MVTEYGIYLLVPVTEESDRMVRDIPSNLNEY